MKFALSIIFSFITLLVAAQDIAVGEYYIDTDPGLGGGISISFTPGTSIDQVFDVDVSSLPDGYHQLFFRFKNADGHWSLFEKRNIFILNGDIDSAPPPDPRQIIAYEYIIDGDPGLGNGEVTNISDTDLLDTVVDIDVSGLTVGYHMISIRVRDTKGRWSIAKSRNIYIVPEPVSPPGSGTDQKLQSYEYFFDNDPGLGNGIGVDITDADTVNHVIDIDVSGLTEGYHNINVRYRNDNGRWSVALTRNFYILKGFTPSTTEKNLSQAEYFIGNDPGIGNGTFIDLGSSANTYDDVLLIDLNNETIDDGDFVISVRVQDTEGVWSIFRSDAFTVCATAEAYYQDFDNDGFGNPDSVRYECSQPIGYVLDNQDCNDSIPEVNVSAVNWYPDSDNDGYGDPNEVIVDCIRPSGYILTGNDCNDMDSLQNPLTVWYLDQDGDGFGVDTVFVEGCEQPSGYALVPGDCNDADPNVLLARWFIDSDGDSFGDPDTFIDACEEPNGYVLNGLDCDDGNIDIGSEIVWYIDNDGDGSGDSSTFVVACIQPAGYVATALDCDDTDASIGNAPVWYFDADHDGYGGDSILYTCNNVPQEFVAAGGDCNDMDSLINPNTRWFRDFDMDTFGSITDVYTGCIPPSGFDYVLDSADCDDDDSLTYPGAIAQPDGKDNDCDGIVDKAIQLITFDPVSDQTDGGGEITLTGSADSGLEVGFLVTGPISREGNTITFLEAGSVTVKAYQEGDERYLPADTVVQTFCINPAPEVDVNINLAVLTSSYNSGNQWLISGAEIPGAVDSTYVALETGNYSVEVTIDGCVGVSVEKAVSLNLGNVLPLNVSTTFPDKFYSGDTVITITPTEGVFPYTVSFKYRKMDSPEFTTLTREVNRNETFEFELNEAEVGELGFVFSATVTDRGGNGKEISEKYVYRAFEDDNSPQIPGLSFGGGLDNYRIISIPYKLDDNEISTIFQKLFPLDPEKWRLVRWKSTGGWEEASKEQIKRIELGKGYFFNSVQSTSLNTGSGRTIEAPFQMTLESGWNQIGNPYNIPLQWSEILSQNNVAETVRSLKLFNPSAAAYVDGDNLTPYSGGFVFADERITLRIDPSLNGSGGRKSEDFAIEAMNLDKDWYLPLKIQISNEIIELGGPGMHQHATVGYDKFDEITVPRFIYYTDLHARHEEHSFSRFSRDIVAAKTEHSWNFSLESNFVSGPVTLFWDQDFLSKSQAQLVLVDGHTGNKVNMKEKGNYSLHLEGQYPLSIYYLADPNAEILPEKLMLGEAFPNPAYEDVTIPLLFPAESKVYDIELAVYDLNGRKVKTIANDTFQPGYYTIPWDRKNESGETVKSGIYVYQLSFRQEGYVPVQKRLIIQR